MEVKTIAFPACLRQSDRDEQLTLEHLRHYLPAQAALKDFVHHNTLHAFQHEKFHDALWNSSNIFGYTTYLSIDEFRQYYASGKIKPEIFNRVLFDHCEKESGSEIDPSPIIHYWKEKLLTTQYETKIHPRIGRLRKHWKNKYGMNMDKVVHPLLFRLLSAFLDQGIAAWKFPINDKNFLESLRELEQNKLSSIFKTPRAKKLLLDGQISLTELLKIVVGDSKLFEHYIFDQQFAHPGWSGFVSVVEVQPETLLSFRKISLKELVYLELLLEIDALDSKFGETWKPISDKVTTPVVPIFNPVDDQEVSTVLKLWQEAFEWSYFDSVLNGIQQSKNSESSTPKSFQGLFCIDDRAYSFRRHIEIADPKSETFGTPGFFGVEFFFQPENGKFYTKACPAPMTPTFLIKEKGRKNGHKKDPLFTKHSHSLVAGWLISGTLGFWSALKLFVHIFKPSVSPAMAYSFSHMDKHASLIIDASGETEAGLQVGYTNEEMAERVKNVLKSIGLSNNFAPLVYIVGHGGSSVNNPYYAGYDCGACCGRPGAVNARVFAYMANKKEVRLLLQQEGLTIPDATLFVGAMHDTTRDEIEFYDDAILSEELSVLHKINKKVFRKALVLNAKERSFRFDTLNSNLPLKKLHIEIKKRSVSLFEPRPEWNHTDNALCIIGRKSLYDNLYLDKRPFINSYDYSQDSTGKYLLAILNAAIPVCGGINLEYYFSRVDQQKLGAGTKLPHNVVGLFAVNNGIDGDLRPGLPSQMIEIHDAVRILFIIEHLPDVVLNVIQSNPGIYEWVDNEWVLFSVKNPETNELLLFKNGQFEKYQPIGKSLKIVHTEEEIHASFKKDEPLLINV